MSWKPVAKAPTASARKAERAMPRWIWSLALCCAWMGVGILWTLSASAAAPQPTIRSQATQTPLDVQLAEGEKVYRLVCSACHAYSGEGLTDAWRSTWAPPDQNCWQSKCHASNHPPDGFALPHFVPAIAGPGTLTGINSAHDLYKFISDRMPFQDPGYIPEGNFWDVTAWVLHLNNISLGPDPVGPTNAALIALHNSSAASGPLPAAGPGQPTLPHPASAGLSSSWSFGGATFGFIGLALVVGLLAGALPPDGRDRR